MNKEKSSSEQEALSKATPQNPALRGQYLSHATPPYYAHISSHGQLSRPYYDSSMYQSRPAGAWFEFELVADLGEGPTPLLSSS